MDLLLHLLPLLLLFISIPSSSPANSPAPAPSPGCNGILLTYSLDGRNIIRPHVSNPKSQPYSFTATATILNSGDRDLLSWAFLISFRHRELIVSASPGVLTDGSAFPYSTPQDSPTSFSGFPNTDLKTPIETANDLTQIQTSISIVGTLFGSPPPAIPLPFNLSLSDPSYRCPAPDFTFNSTTSISSCCVFDPTFDNSTTSLDNSSVSEPFLPRRSGDLTISYDVIQSFSSSYLALVTIANNAPLGRLDNWRLSWQWMHDEFIYSMRGAYTSVSGANDCIFGIQGQYYQDLDFSKVLNCQRSPTILDLPVSMFNDTDRGRIPFCCRNGTILPSSMDASQAKSAFQVQVFKMRPDLNRTKLYPPQNFKISGISLNPDYQCSQPIRVSPSQFPDPSGLQASSTAVSSWQVVCNITNPKSSSSKCCVSFSSFYNDSVIPCKTCACGCPASSSRRTCNTTAPALLLPPQALLVPFDNRTLEAKAWASIKHFQVPNPLPCPDNCGVSINWHVYTDYSGGWSSRITLFNWEDTSLANWFVALDMGKAYDGFEASYSFNGTAIGNNTVFLQGFDGLNYLVGEVDGANPGDPRIPGKQQSVISFSKKNTPGIDVVAGDGYPKKVFFNGEECSLPDYLPSNGGSRIGTGFSLLGLCLTVVVATTLLVLQQ
ncbi:COBRA-like protein 7 [Dioscorea cayenensis subsp. rotundata]|uniref:COBRA-like protein 7 n=1 Tax=Dioscorea cayennensis subsp. rotundata TaxID=55577 RepID=A0AB40BQ27_DIOCR|nr:COBRA-like protein 7 [Dioscorea cayenensis subsp. rotundata]